MVTVDHSTARVSNWGRWGPEDELGVANLLTDERRLKALTIPKRGRVLHLSYLMPHPASPGREQLRPMHLLNLPFGTDHFTFATDYVGFHVHGSTTHIDAIGHIWHGGALYNGYEATGALRIGGLTKSGIDKAPPLITRGLILDIAAVQGKEHLDPHYEVSVADLEAALERVASTVEPGDAVLIRTGWPSMFARDANRFFTQAPGIGMDAAEWLARHDPVLVGSDNSGVEKHPQGVETQYPVHRLLLRDCGIHLIELLALDELAAECQSPFLFIGIPLRLTGGTGSPIPAVAVL
jgi:kynurenine formamidase